MATGPPRPPKGADLKILQLHNRYREPGGEDVVVEREAALLRAAGHDVAQRQVRNPEEVGATTAALAVGAWNPAAARRVRALVERHAPDVVHVHNTWYALTPSVFRAVRETGVPVVTTLHNYRPLCVNGLLFREGAVCEDCVGTFPWRGVVRRCHLDSVVASGAVAAMATVNRWRRTWHRDLDLILVPSAFAKSRLVAGGLPEATLHVKPNVVPDPGPRSRPPSASTTVVYAGRMVAEKGGAALLDAWEALADGELELVFVGDGPLRAPLEARGVPRVRFAGHLPAEAVRDLMLGARALACPAEWYETYGLVVAESLAAGLPVLASDLGGLPELVGKDGAGRTVPPGDVEGWVEALAWLRDDAAVDAAGRVGRARYEQRFSEAADLAALEEAYALARHPPRR